MDCLLQRRAAAGQRGQGATVACPADRLGRGCAGRFGAGRRRGADAGWAGAVTEGHYRVSQLNGSAESGQLEPTGERRCDEAL